VLTCVDTNTKAKYFYIRIVKWTFDHCGVRVQMILIRHNTSYAVPIHYISLFLRLHYRNAHILSQVFVLFANPQWAFLCAMKLCPCITNVKGQVTAASIGYHHAASAMGRLFELCYF
jgi:hypothetical protein